MLFQYCISFGTCCLLFVLDRREPSFVSIGAIKVGCKPVTVDSQSLVMCPCSAWRRQGVFFVLFHMYSGIRSMRFSTRAHFGMGCLCVMCLNLE